MSNDFNNIGERIELKLKELNLKQVDISKKTGISKNSISNYVNDIRIPDNISCYKIAQLFSVSMEWILTGKDYNYKLIDPEESIELNDINEVKLTSIKDNNIINCNQLEKKLILDYRHLDRFDKVLIVNIVKIMNKRYEK